MTRTCPACGETFQPLRHIGRPSAKDAFCSEECWQKEWREVHMTPGRMKPKVRHQGSFTWWKQRPANSESSPSHK